jgi:hypothetical protein
LLPATEDERNAGAERTREAKVDLSEHLTVNDAGDLISYDLQTPRTIVLCFDGTSNEFDDTNTNVVKLFSCLKKNSPNDQAVYYQTGIGTYTPEGAYNAVTTLGKKVTETADQAVAWYLRDHVIGGYRYLMQTYREGDRVLLFGFSRGAYTARALAGMIHAVGLLPLNNEEHIQFAYGLYQNAQAGDTKCARFKRTFSSEVYIDFVGVWDTVASVGAVVSKTLPFTTSNDSILTFRHAISLDETRAKFQPLSWVDPPDQRFVVDVEEVCFLGDHSDVGGGHVADSEYTPPDDSPLDSHVPDLKNYTPSLANIPLRWMISQALLTVPEFDLIPDQLKRWQIPFRVDEKLKRIVIDDDTEEAREQERLDAKAEVHVADAKWTPLEWWPGAKASQDPQTGETVTSYKPNNFSGRTLLKCQTHNKYCLHRTVLYRHEVVQVTTKDWLGRKSDASYTPKAAVSLDPKPGTMTVMQDGKTIPDDLRYTGGKFL